MANDLIRGTNGLHVDAAATFTPTELRLDKSYTYDSWSDIGRALAKLGNSNNWWLGDWLNAGEMTFGEMYAQAASDTGLKEEYLRQLKFVASRIPAKMRNPKLKWSHHRIIAQVPNLSEAERIEWVTEAAESYWSVEELRDELKAKYYAKEEKPIEEIDKPISIPEEIEDAIMELGELIESKSRTAMGILGDLLKWVKQKQSS